jgi:outer membrane protein OmpA-like peptidoglycan-associated protein
MMKQMANKTNKKPDGFRTALPAHHAAVRPIHDHEMPRFPGDKASAGVGLQRQAINSDELSVVPPIVFEVLRSPGQPLNPVTRRFMGPRFGHDFAKTELLAPAPRIPQANLAMSRPGDRCEQQADQVMQQVMTTPELPVQSCKEEYDFKPVRVHTDHRSAEAARALNAHAFTVGNHIVFGPGQYRPGTSEGNELIAHELVHVIQQSGASLDKGTKLGLQRRVRERDFPADGRIEEIRPGEHLLWNFAVGQDTLKPEHRAELPRIAREINTALSQNPNWQVDIEGQASSSATDPTNDPLSQRRAQHVMEALVAAGVEAARIRVTFTGERKARPETTPENMARSRAVRIILVPRIAAASPAQPAPTAATAPTPETTETPARSSQPTRQGAQQPACQVRNSALSLTGGTVTENRIDAGYKIQAGNDTPSNIGMLFLGLATFNRPGCGELLYLQNVKPFREIVYKDGSRLRQETSSWHLDTSDPYPSQAFPSSRPRGLVRTANDSPALSSGRIRSLDFTEGLINSMEIRDEFRMFLMFLPRGGTRQTLQVGTWTFIGQAQTTSTEFGTPDTPRGRLRLDTDISRVVPSSGTGSPSSQPPSISPNVTSLRFQKDRAGLTTNQTFADLFEPILNSGP